MTAWLWIGFLALVLVMLALDLGVFNKGDHVFTTREALGWTAVWVTIALLFTIVIYFMYEHHWLGIAAGTELNGREASIQYLTGYVIEKSLSLDNIFVIALVFQYFHVPTKYQHRVLFWGILGALVMRGVMIAAGAALLHSFSWTIYLFGGFLVLTAVRMMMGSTEKIDPEHNLLVRLARRFLPVSRGIESHDFFTRIDGRRAVTPLFLVLLVVESTDVVFAVDSIPAIFAVTSDPYLVFTSNIFAILGLRSLYFALASLLTEFRYLKQSLVIVLAYVGVKMLLSHHVKIPALLSLGIIATILAAGVIASIVRARRAPAAH
ncbi:TerC family protein [Myxococcota bacterium]|nr:TerC family protein [Myxococcota bacterium]